jgi:hypothetical protein
VRAGRAGELSRSTASRICEELRERFEQFKRRSLYDVHLVALFLDATFISVRPSGPEEGVLVALGFTEEGERVLLAVTLGMREAYEDWQALGRDLIARGLGAPMLIVADGAPGTKAIEQCWPACDRQRCCVHRARNLYAKLPEREPRTGQACLLASVGHQRPRCQAATTNASRPAREGGLYRRGQMSRRRSGRARGSPALPSSPPPALAVNESARTIARRGQTADQSDGPLPQARTAASRSCGPCSTC